MKILLKKTAILFLLITVNSAFSQKAKELFQSEELLKITLKFDIRKVTSDIKIRKEREADLSYLQADGSKITHKIKMNVRGNSRTNKDVCSFPPLKLNLKKKEVKNTLFNKQNKLKLVTHCNNSKRSEGNVKTEYLIYQLYQIINTTSIKARLCEVTYVDTRNNRKTFTKIGILLEDIDDVAKRNDVKVFENKIRNQESLEKTNLDKLIFFQYMIGNLDWSVPNRHNMKIIKAKSKGLPIAVPYDFDYSGFVNASYSVPPVGFNISSTRTRVFRGICRVNNYGPTIQFYQNKKSELYKKINEATFLDDKKRASLLKYMDDFYEVLDSPKLLTKKIIKACRAKHKHRY